MSDFKNGLRVTGDVAVTGAITSTVPAAGSFTTLSATSGLAVTGGISSTDVLNIGRVANGTQATFSPVAGRGLEIAAVNIAGVDGGASVLNARGVGSGTLMFQTDSVERMRLDRAGNLGLGVTPSAWVGGKWMQFQSTSSVGQQANGTANLMCNAYESSSNNFTYIASAAATRYNAQVGTHAWYTAPSGTAGAPISFIQAMTLSASGALTVVGAITGLNLSGANTGDQDLSAMVTLEGTQTLTNKTISGAANTITADGTNAVGFRHIPQNPQSVAYTLALTDAGKHILHPSADTTARIFTIPANASVAYPIGAAITFINQASAGVLTIAITTDVMRLAGAGTTGSRTLAANGVATAIKLTATEWIISGGSSLT